MSEENQRQEFWQNSPTDRTYLPTDAGLLNSPGKSSSPLNSNVNDNDKKVDNARFEFARLKQKQVEDEISFELKRLELERQLAKTKIETEIAQLENACHSVGCKIDEEVRVSANLNARMDPMCLTEFMYKLDLPKLELPYFDGDSSQYHYFVREFETQIESRVKQDGQRLSYLLHYCRGRAKRAISGCVMLPEANGYSNARTILSDMFGRAHVVARALLDKIVNGKPVKNSSDDLWELSIEMQNCYTTLCQMAYLSDLNSHTTIEKVVRRLPYEFQQRWVEKASEIYDKEQEPSFKDLIDFIVKRARVAGCRYSNVLVSRDEQHKTNAGNLRDRFSKSAMTLSSSMDETPEKCTLCKLSHSLDKCPAFSSMSASNRWRYVTRGRRCFICLIQGHMAADCKQITKCGLQGCIELHHKMLHKDRQIPSHSVNATESIVRSADLQGKVSLGIIAVNVVGPKGKQLTYALVDNGSDSTFISQRLAKNLGVLGDSASVSIKTLNSVRTERSSKVSFVVESIDGHNHVTVDQAFTIARLDLGLGCPLSTGQLNRWKHLTDVEIVNIGQLEVELLIGCNAPEAHWTLEQRTGNRHQPFAVKTVLGWVLFGPLEEHSTTANSLCLLSSCNIIEQQLATLYNHEFEDVSEHRALSIEDSEAVRQVSNSISLENGHFVVGLPWKRDISDLPNNINVAHRRLIQLKKKFTLDSNLYAKYRDLMQRHLDLGYAILAPDNLLNARVKWYLPHHPVLNAKKPGKVRVVFDCAAKHLGVSLNDYLLQGPNMIQNLVAVMTRFRKEKFALSGDIQEMFLQVRVPTEDRNIMRFLWWDEHDIKKSVREFQLTVHPFGAKSSPFCASFALQQSVELYHGKNKHQISEVVKNNFYVDDCLLCSDSEEDLNELRKRLCDLLQSVGFHLTKWMSNSKVVLTNIPPDECTKSIVNLSLESLPTERTLGLLWDAQSDCFKFDVHLPERPVTRRGMLSCVSSLYDPLGFVSPILLPAKLILQELCRRRLGWDDPVDDDINQSWRQWLINVNKLKDLQIRRCLKPSDSKEGEAPELHLFSDASERGYGVVAYLRYALCDGKYGCSLLFGKSRVTPLKSVSVPRLELVAAVLAVKVVDLITREALVEPSRTYYWTDSMTVLYYIANTTSRFATFVANRVTFILAHSEVDQWRFVTGTDNPADYASRGLAPLDAKFEFWLNGPLFLRSPLELIEAERLTTIPEGCELKKVHNSRVTIAESSMHSLLTHYSSWYKLQRAVVWLRRFKTYLTVMYGIKPDMSVMLGPIQLEEINDATSDIISLIQKEDFSTEVQHLKAHGRCKSLAKLNPLLHDGILVLGGRLRESKAFRPILPSNNVVTELIIRHYHVAEGHAGLQHVLSTIRDKFWIVKGAATVKRALNSCAKCRLLNAKPMQQQMAQLPDCRTSPGVYAFDSCGVDYFGPLFVQQGRSVVKRWGCLFTCLRSRAVHIEIVHSLSTDSFIMALVRFIARRGCPKEMFSDNGSNFVGADNELRNELRLLSQEKITNNLLAKGIQWHFQPPDSSHRGGVWERLIRSVRKILRAISNERVIRDEILLTYLAEVERILNNRPLIPVYDDSRDAVALTPNDLLLLKAIEPIVCDASVDLQKYTKWWKQAWHLSNAFWKRWTRDYLPTLEQRQKWFFPQPNFKIGDVVLVTSDLGTKGEWPLGRIVATYPGDDGLVRKVDVVTSKGKLHRDIRKVCLLEGDIDGNK